MVVLFFFLSYPRVAVKICSVVFSVEQKVVCPNTDRDQVFLYSLDKGYRNASTRYFVVLSMLVFKTLHEVEFNINHDEKQGQ